MVIGHLRDIPEYKTTQLGGKQCHVSSTIHLYPRTWNKNNVYIILQIFLAASTVLKIGEYHSDIPQFKLWHISLNADWLIQSLGPVQSILTPFQVPAATRDRRFWRREFVSAKVYVLRVYHASSELQKWHASQYFTDQ